MKRILGASFTLVIILALTVSSVAIAQGTTGTSASGTCIGTACQLNTGTSIVAVSGEAGNVAGATADPVGVGDLGDLGGDGNSPPPAGTGFLSEGVTVGLTDANGNPVNFASATVLVCFPDTGVGTVRHWNATLGRWVTFPTFASNGLRCARTRLPGTYAVIG